MIPRVSGMEQAVPGSPPGPAPQSGGPVGGTGHILAATSVEVLGRAQRGQEWGELSRVSPSVGHSM